MDWLLFAILCGVTLGLIISGLTRPGKIYEFPFLAGTTFLGFVIPQLPAYANDPFLPEGAFAKTALMTIFCVAACGAGWAAGNRPMRVFAWRYDENHLIWVAVVLSLAGAFFYYKIDRLPHEMLMVRNWSGIATVWYFLSRLVGYGLAIALLCVVRRPRAFSIVAVLFGTLLMVDRIIVAGRRQEFVEFLLALGLSFWFQRGVALPRAIALAGALAVGVGWASTADYRDVSLGLDSKWSQVAKISFLQNFVDMIQNGGLEMHNAIVLIDFTDKTQEFDFGAFNWNTLVFNFVPAQFVGQNFKNSLMLPAPASDRNYNPIIGTTTTGMADSFMSFWYFGAAKFFLIAYLLGRIYRAAMSGSTTAQVLYILSITTGMMAITHHTQEIFSLWVQLGVFVFPGLALARARISKDWPRSWEAAGRGVSSAAFANLSEPRA